VRFQFHNTNHKYIMTLPVNSGCTIGDKGDIDSKEIISSKNANDYHEDWPFELKEMTVEVDGIMT